MVKEKSNVNYKVQWTKEFMDKVKRSNDRYNKQRTKLGKDSSKGKTVQENDIMNVKILQKGDGVHTEVDEVDSDIQDELLDYEDDLSIEEVEEESLDTTDNAEVSHQEETSVPGTSMGRTVVGTEKQAISQLNEQNEEKLMQNPVIQRMMTKFFDERFKNLQATGLSLVENGKSDKNLVKSPSDTTIYAPTLQKILTPQDKNVNNVATLIVNDENMLETCKITNL